MKPDIKEKLVTALPNYPKTQGQLYQPEVPHNPEGYCCLGVLCILYQQEVNAEASFTAGGNWFNIPDGADYQKELAPIEVLEWAGLTGEDADKLANINDHNNTFAPVIRHLQENL